MSIEPRSTNPNHRQQRDYIKTQRLTQLSKLLKSCRQRIDPETVGLPVRPRRRNPGLSRSEVATLAQMSVDWYTWLEQGRDIHPSVEVLNQLAKVFQLTEPEKRHLYSLCEHTPVLTEILDADIQLMQGLITHLAKVPAFVLRKDWQILAQNDAADKFFNTWSNLKDEDKNLLYLFFTEPIFTQHLREWEWHAKLAIRQFRAIYVTEIGNPTFSSLIERLSEISPQFKRWWAETDVTGRDYGRKEFDHPVFGYCDYDYTIMRPAENQALEVIAFISRTKDTT